MALLAVPPADSTSWPPELTVVPFATPSEYTTSLPPLSVVPLATPPEDTYSAPPAITLVATVVPPEDTACVPPELTVTPLEVWPAVTEVFERGFSVTLVPPLESEATWNVAPLTLVSNCRVTFVDPSLTVSSVPPLSVAVPELT